MHVSAVQPEESRILLDVVLDVVLRWNFARRDYAIISRNSDNNLSRFDDDGNTDLWNFCPHMLTEDEHDDDPSL